MDSALLVTSNVLSSYVLLEQEDRVDAGCDHADCNLAGRIYAHSQQIMQPHFNACR